VLVELLFDVGVGRLALAVVPVHLAQRRAELLAGIAERQDLQATRERGLTLGLLERVDRPAVGHPEQHRRSEQRAARGDQERVAPEAPKRRPPAGPPQAPDRVDPLRGEHHGNRRRVRERAEDRRGKAHLGSPRDGTGDPERHHRKSEASR
jgi:hypothetical protein